MGTVHLGSDGQRQAAVKLIASAIADDPAFRARFRREVEVCGRVHGAQVADLLDADPDDEVPIEALSTAAAARSYASIE